jgi:DNA repair protein RadD
MQLRERQKEFVKKSIEALEEHGNTLAVAPTGAGKTVCLSAVVDTLSRQDKGAHLVIQHRDELVGQNLETFKRVSKSVPTSTVNADRKAWIDTGVMFGMVQTLARNIEAMPRLSGITIDEAHHAAAPTYQKIIHAAREQNPDLKLYGVTATPNRGDCKALVGVFDNCCDQISLQELIDTGFLVKPRPFVVDVGVQDDLTRVRRAASDFDMNEVEDIMNKEAVTERVIDEWKAKAADRQTIVFCSTVEHAKAVADAFCAAGYNAACVWGDMPGTAREGTLKAYDDGDIQILTNVAVLTEGWDHQPTSCVVMLRPCSFKSTAIQMIGRGLRKVDPERYPGVQKDDCIILDFGTTLLTHGDITTNVNLSQQGLKSCPECDAKVPSQTTVCPICAFEWPMIEGEKKKCEVCGEDNAMNARECWNCGERFGLDDGKVALSKFHMTEIDILGASPYKWTPLFDGVVLVAAAFDAWAMVVSYHGRHYALGGGTGLRVAVLADNEDRRLSLVSADDFLREHGDEDAANKAKRWLAQPATSKQMELLGVKPGFGSIGMTKYEASCRLAWRFNERGVKSKLQERKAA